MKCKPRKLARLRGLKITPQGMVKMLSCNVRGLNGLNKQKEVRLLCNEQEVGLVGLLETRIKTNKVNMIVDSMFNGWHHHSNHASHYNGRIWIIWRPDWFDIDIVQEMAQAVTCRVKFILMQLEFVATFVYAYNVKEDRKMLWDHLSHLSVNRKESWIILGDFNAVLHRDDRLGGNPVTLAEVTDFQNCIDNCGLEEMANSGKKYTWSDKQAARIFSKIDRVLVNGEWVDQMPPINAHVLPEGISDHCPIVVQSLQTSSIKVKSFKYCNVWSTHPDFGDIIQSCWSQPIGGCKMFQVVCKLKALKRQLRVLHKVNFCNLIQQVNHDRVALRRVQRQLQQTPLNDAIQREEKELNVKFRRSSFLAESLLLQRSKVTWIRQGDDNTKYFFSVIKKRKLIQTITQIQDEHGQRQHEQAQIAEVFVRYYQQLLGDSGGPRKPAEDRIFAHGPTVSAEQQ
ncbi:uncharacterized protein LOC132624555 [Lycium barbarum]|uniref:uncharacterized protein LOC132624555 n=1 Tax=Lycium barbarum TaxID=112863 RepID=UPI00293E5455|nr:uncharacterized protein LOC132624555 [Lycium barbarum]